ncbi:hypothetical protein ROZALSC1DRAFT_25663, partial [Rozella allomycis CSF55]
FPKFENLEILLDEARSIQAKANQTISSQAESQGQAYDAKTILMVVVEEKPKRKPKNLGTNADRYFEEESDYDADKDYGQEATNEFLDFLGNASQDYDVKNYFQFQEERVFDGLVLRNPVEFGREDGDEGIGELEFLGVLMDPEMVDQIREMKEDCVEFRMDKGVNGIELLMNKESNGCRNVVKSVNDIELKFEKVEKKGKVLRIKEELPEELESLLSLNDDVAVKDETKESKLPTRILKEQVKEVEEGSRNNMNNGQLNSLESMLDEFLDGI